MCRLNQCSRLRGALLMYKHLKEGCKGDRDRLFLDVPSEKVRGNVQKQKHRKFHIKIRKGVLLIFLTVRVTEQEQVTSHLERLWSLSILRDSQKPSISLGNGF